MGFRPILGLWHLEKFRAQAENTKTQFPGAGGTLGGNPDARIAQLFYVLFVLADWTATGGEWQNTGFRAVLACGA